MRIFELEKPKTPEQLKLDQLRATSKRASDALKIERDRQKAQFALAFKRASLLHCQFRAWRWYGWI